MWDEDTGHKSRLQVMLLGSSPLLMQKGLSESLAGRFEVIPVTHWSFSEMQAAFSWNLVSAGTLKAARGGQIKSGQSARS